MQIVNNVKIITAQVSAQAAGVMIIKTKGVDK
jgi:hypothetical protein